MRIWDLETGRLVQRVDGHVERPRFTVGPSRTGFTDPGTFATFLPESHRVVSAALAAAHGQLLVWDVTTGKHLRRLVGHEDLVTAVAASSDGRWIASASADLTIRVWAADTGNEFRSFYTGSRNVWSLGLSPDGRWVVSGGFLEPVRVWDVATGGPGRSLGGPDGPRGPVAISPDGRIVAATGSRAVVMWELPTGRELDRISVPWPVASALTFTADGRHLVSGNSDGTLTVFDVRTARALRAATENVVTVSVMAFSPDGERSAVSGGDGELRLWRLKDLGLTPLRKDHEDRITAVAFSSDGRWLLSGSSDRTARLWDGVTGTQVRAFHAYDGVTAVTFSPDGETVIAASEHGVIQVWNRETGQLASVLWGPRTQITRIVASSDGRRLVSFGGTWKYQDRARHFAGAALTTWDLTAGEIVASTRPDGGHAALSPDGRLAITDTGAGNLRIWDTDSLTTTRMVVGHESWVQAMALSQEGRWLLSGSQDRTLRLRDLTAVRGCVMSREAPGLFAVAMTPDGRLGASTGDRATVRVWDLVAGQELARLVSYTDGGWVALTPDGFYDGSPGAEQRLRLRTETHTYDVGPYRSILNRPDRVRSRLARAFPEQVGDDERRCASDAPRK